MDCRRAGLVQTTSFVPLAVVASMIPEAVAALLAPKLNVGMPRLQLAATPS